MTSEIEKDLEAVLDKAAAEVARPSPLRPVPSKPVSLSEQWAQKERIEQELYQRVRRQKIDILAEHDRLWAETKSDFERRIDFAVSKLEAERRQALKTLADQTAEKLRDHDLLMQRIAFDAT